MTITALPPAPSTNDPSTFDSKADALIAALPTFINEVNGVANGLNFPGLMANSTTSVVIGTGSKSFTINTGKTFVAGQSIFVQYTTTPTNWMYGTVTSYNSATGALVVNVTSVLGSGTYALWTVSLATPLVSSLGFSMAGLLNQAVGANIASAATVNLSTATGNTVHITGTVATSAVTMNPGQWMECIADAAWPLTYHATNNNINGGVSYTCAAGDRILYFYDGTTVYGNIIKQDGTAVAVPVAQRKVAQIVTTQVGTVATGTTVLPADNTIPQNTEGDQYLSVAITPTNASSTLEIDVEIILSSGAAASVGAALFQDATAGALAAMLGSNTGASNVAMIKFKHVMAAGTVSATTFKVRGGAGAAGTTTFNGVTAGQIYGGVMASRITIKEFLP